MDKVKIEKIIVEDFKSVGFDDWQMAKRISSSLTSLIIKWLEGKRQALELLHGKKHTKPLDILIEGRKEGRNQLITELIGEVR